jgi:NADH-quinone oxidoreductase subunit J
MSFYTGLMFYLLAAVVLVPGVCILFSRDIVHAAFWLMASLAGVAGLYLMLGADFLGFAQVLVYIGGILILIIFGLMVTHKEKVSLHQIARKRLLLPALVTGAITLLGLLTAIRGTSWAGATEAPLEPTSARIGYHLMSDYLLPFEVASILLLVGLVAGVYIARRREQET